MKLLYPTYFPDAVTFSLLANASPIIWEVQGNYQKQTYRNRAFICNDRGKHMLSIPIAHLGKHNSKQRYKDVQIDNSYPWQRQHWRTLETAYRTSPYFEFYEDDLKTLYTTTFTNLLDFNLKTIEIICVCLQLEMPLNKTAVFQLHPVEHEDYRSLVSSKKNSIVAEEGYIQVFNDRHKFISNLSILDLLFNLGPETITYLKKLHFTQNNA